MEVERPGTDSDQSMVFPENYARGPGGRVGPLVQSRAMPLGVGGAKLLEAVFFFLL